jgi:WD40 repeat protein
MNKVISDVSASLDSSRNNNLVTMEEVINKIDSWDCHENLEMKGHTGAVWSITSTSDNLVCFSGSEDKTIIVWDGLTLQKKAVLTGHTNTINVLEITKDNKYLISGDWNGKLFVWDWKESTKVGEFVGHTGGVYCNLKTKAGDILVTGSGDYTAKVWNMNTRALIASLDCNGSSVFGIALTSDEKTLITGGWDGNIRAWDFVAKSLTSTTEGKAGVIQSMAITPNMKFLIFGTRNNIVKVWNWPEKTEYFSYLEHNNWVRNLATTQDNKFFITASADRTVRLINILEKEEEFNFDKNDGYVFGLHLSVDGTILYSGASDNILRKRIIGKTNKVNIMEGHSKCVMSIAITSNSLYIVSGSEDKTVRVWSLNELKEVACLTNHQETVWGVAVTENIKYFLSVSGDKNVMVWNFHDYSLAQTFTGHTNPIFCVHCSSDSKLAATGGQDKVLMLWDLNEMKLVKKFEGHTDTIFTVKFTETSQELISGAADYTIRVWSVKNLSIIKKYDTKSGMIESLAVSRDEQYMILGDRANSVYLWNNNEKKLLKKFSDHTGRVKTVAFSHDNKFFASCSNDFRIIIWSVEEKRKEIVILGHTKSIRSLGFTNNGRHLVSAGEDLGIKVWDLNDDDILKTADYSDSLDTFLLLNCAKNLTVPKPFICAQSFSPLRVNLCHIFAYNSHNELLRIALENGANIRIDAHGNSPLHYAIERNTQNCIDTILVYLNEISTTNKELFWEYCWSIRSDFVKLLKNSSIHLPEFLNKVFLTSTQELPSFGVPLGALPYHIYTDDLIIDPKNFLHSEYSDQSKEIMVEFHLTPFKIDMISGSQGSLILLNNIHSCPNTQIYRSHIVQVLVESRWNKFWWFILVLTFLNWINIAVMMILLLDYINNDGALIGYGIINCILLFYELLLAFSIGLINYWNFWNFIDFVRTLVCIAWIITDIYFDEGSFYGLTYAMVILNFTRGLSGFRAFDSTRYYSKLILIATYEAIPFIIIFFYATLAFGMLNWASDTQYRTDTFVAIWKSPYEINMGFPGNSPSTSPDLNYLYFTLASIINNIIILNLLVSILGNSFDKFQSEAVEIGTLEKAELVIEIETIMIWRRGYNKKQFLQVCDKVEFEGVNDDWQGKIKAIGDVVKKADKHNKIIFDKIKTRLASIQKKVSNAI